MMRKYASNVGKHLGHWAGWKTPSSPIHSQSKTRGKWRRCGRRWRRSRNLGKTQTRMRIFRRSPVTPSPGKESEMNMVFCKKCWRYHESVTVCPAPIIPARRDYFEDDDKTAEIARLRAEIVRLQGGEQETLSDQKRERLFKGTGIDYIRHRALKHEKEYHDLSQAQWLRKLATDLETTTGTIRIENEALRTKIGAIAAKWDAMNGIDEAENFATDLREALARHPVESKGEEP